MKHIEETYKRFDEKLAQHLIDTKQVCPVAPDKSTPLGADNQRRKHDDGSHYWEPKDGKWGTWAVITGEKSGLVVLDADTREAVDRLVNAGFRCSYVTGSDNHEFGAHFYFDYDSRIPKTSFDHIDVQTNNALVKFCGPGKEGNSKVVINDSAKLVDWLESQNVCPGPAPALSHTMGESISEPMSESYECNYEWGVLREALEIEGKSVGVWRLDKNEPAITNKFAKQIAKLKRGERSKQLQRIVFEAARLDLNLNPLREAAKQIEAEDFDARKIEACFREGIAALDAEFSSTLEERVLYWHQCAVKCRGRRNKGHFKIIDYVVAKAIHNHDYKPQINLKRLERREIGFASTFRDQRKILVKAGLLKVIKPNEGGYSDNWQLCLDGVPIQNVPNIDEIVFNNLDPIWHDSVDADFLVSYMDYQEGVDPNLKAEVEAKPEPAESTGPMIFRDLKTLKAKICGAEITGDSQSHQTTEKNPQILTETAITGATEPGQVSAAQIEAFKAFYAASVWISEDDVNEKSLRRYKQQFLDMADSKNLPNELKCISTDITKLHKIMEAEICKTKKDLSV